MILVFREADTKDPSVKSETERREGFDERLAGP
jgi:hypothetical protein